MDRRGFRKSAPGQLINAPGGYLAYVPAPLPPDLAASWELTSLSVEATQRLSLLSGLGQSLSNPELLMQPLIRREAVLSSAIEGTESTLTDLLLYEAEGSPSSSPADAQEVHNYVVALNYGLQRVDTLPLSLRLIREIHARLMDGVRGQHATPGEFRKSQNWIGRAGSTLTTATYVPPPVPEMHECLAQLEQFLHAPSKLPLVIRVALVHYQFEAIHPFLDGNGRLGRLLITLLLCHAGLLEAPLLNLSVYIERLRPTYYDLLLKVTTEGAWREWLEFFLQGFIEQATDGMTRTRRLMDLQTEYRSWAQTASSSALLVGMVDELFAQPAFRVEHLAQRLEKTPQAIRFQLEKMLEHGIVREQSGRARNRIYFADAIIQAASD